MATTELEPSAALVERRPSGWRWRATLWTLRIVVILALLSIWEVIPRLGIVDAFWISQPSRIYTRLITDLPMPDFWVNIWATVEAVLLGILIGAGSGVVVGTALGFLPRVYAVFEPVMVALYTLPRIALAPLFIIWFGIDIRSKVALVFSLVFFLMLLNSYVGVRNVDRDLIDSVRTMGSSRWFVARRVLLPSSIPWLLTGLRLSFVYGIGAAVVGEMLISRYGLGTLLTISSNNFDTTGVFEILTILFVFGYAANELVALTERRFLGWNK
jgi:NitT/TauT family transport system permease protein